MNRGGKLKLKNVLTVPYSTRVSTRKKKACMHTGSNSNSILVFPAYKGLFPTWKQGLFEKDSIL